MRILHYFLGFHRAGGLNRYAGDLAREQARQGHEVFALFPDGSVLPRRRAVIAMRRPHDRVGRFELLGGDPVPLLSGIRDPRMILAGRHRLSGEAVARFCDVVRPEVFHIHTWMGFPEELLDELKRRGTKIVFTTHDYFGLCPKVNFIDASGKMCDAPDDRKCTVCNAGAPSERALAIRNSRMLLSMKKLLRPLAAALHHRSGAVPEAAVEVPEAGDYTALREHYIGLLRRCDVIHANSEVSAGVYRRFAPDLPLRMVPISHSVIVDRRRRRSVGEVVKLVFSGPGADFKGLPQLLRVLNDLYGSGIRNWRLDVWGASECAECPGATCHGSYDAARSAEVFGNGDLLIVPSIWNETFGFVIPEALSFGTPVLCSDTVGAQTLVPPEMVYHGENGLRDKLEFLLRRPEELDRINRELCEAEFVWDMKSHTEKMSMLYNGAL